MREVRLHRAAAHEKAGTDLRVGEAFGDEADDFELGRGEARPAGGGSASPAAGAAGVFDALVEGELCTFDGRAVERCFPGRL
jgi:hypothetical protein